MSAMVPPPEAQASDATAPRSVLVVDDDDDLREAVADALREEGWRVTEARDAVDALAQIDAGPPDLILLDERMPGMSGTELYGQLQRRGMSPRVVLMSAAGSVRQLARAFGIAYWLAKPFAIEDAVQLLQEAGEKAAQESR